jgi:hypothetical protein
VLVVDHKLGDVWLLALTPAAAAAATAAGAGAAAAVAELAAAAEWLHEAAGRVQVMASQVAPGSSSSSSSQLQQQQLAPVGVRAAAQLRHDRAAYVANAAACREALAAGDSYELCLTTSFTMDSKQGMQVREACTLPFVLLKAQQLFCFAVVSKPTSSTLIYSCNPTIWLLPWLPARPSLVCSLQSRGTSIPPCAASTLHPIQPGSVSAAAQQRPGSPSAALRLSAFCPAAEAASWRPSRLRGRRGVTRVTRPLTGRLLLRCWGARRSARRTS